MNLFLGQHQVITEASLVAQICRSNLNLLIAFAAVYDDTECGETLSDFEGFVNTSLISPDKIEYVVRHKLQLDCMWVIEVEEEWKVRQH